MERYFEDHLIRDLLLDVNKLLKVPVKFENETKATIDLRINDSFFDVDISNLLESLSKKWEGRIFKGTKGFHRFGNIISFTKIKRDGPYVYLTLPFHILNNVSFYFSILDENIVSQILQYSNAESRKVLLKLVKIDIERTFKYLTNLEFPEEFRLLNEVYQDQSKSERFSWMIIYDRFKTCLGGDKECFLYLPGNLGARVLIKRDYPGIYNKIPFNKGGFMDYYTGSENIYPSSIIYEYLKTGKFPEGFELGMEDVYASQKDHTMFHSLDGLLSLMLSDTNVKFKSCSDFLNMLNAATNSGTYEQRTLDALGKDKLQAILDTEITDRDDINNYFRLFAEIKTKMLELSIL